MAYYYNRWFLSSAAGVTNIEYMQNLINTTLDTTTNVYITEPLGSSTSLLTNSNIQLSNLATQKTTAATVPSTSFPGVDIVVYETFDNQQR